MRPYQNLTDEQLVEEYASAKAYADELYARLDDFKLELHQRFLESGQLTFENATHKVTMKKQSPSVAWLEREFGISGKEIPADCMEEKISLAPDWAKVKGWLEAQDLGWKETYTPALQGKKLI
jgi:hypothetical protein